MTARVHQNAPMRTLPGTALQQALLEAITDTYCDDARVRAVVLFGSLARNDWDGYSDLDLAIVLQDDVQLDIAYEVDAVRDMLHTRGNSVLFAQVAGNDGYLLSQSLNGIALQYSALKATPPYVLAGCAVLCGSLSIDELLAAGRANTQPAPPLDQEIHRALWLALDVDIKLQRRQFWSAVRTIGKIRDALMGVFVTCRGGRRTDQGFEAEASAAWKAKFGATLPQYRADSPSASIRSLADALDALLWMMEHDLDELSLGKIRLGPGELEAIRHLRARQHALRKTL